MGWFLNILTMARGTWHAYQLTSSPSTPLLIYSDALPWPLRLLTYAQAFAPAVPLSSALPTAFLPHSLYLTILYQGSPEKQDQ